MGAYEYTPTEHRKTKTGAVDVSGSPLTVGRLKDLLRGAADTDEVYVDTGSVQTSPVALGLPNNPGVGDGNFPGVVLFV